MRNEKTELWWKKLARKVSQSEEKEELYHNGTVHQTSGSHTVIWVYTNSWGKLEEEPDQIE